MLDSDQEPSYNLSKNLLFLPRILKLIVDMVDDSTLLLNFILGIISYKESFRFYIYFSNSKIKWVSKDRF